MCISYSGSNMPLYDFGLKMKIGKTISLVSYFQIMCLSPIKIPTKSLVIGSVYSQKLYNYVSCGECCDCQRKRSQEWLFRASWQFEEVKFHNGYALFDTLTYSNENLPYLSHFLGSSDVDFPCFSLPDIQEFLNRLRIKIRRYLGLKVSEKLPIKYFLSSEYGSSEKGTHRPHYHIVLYVFDSRLKPLDLSFMISDCWKKGRTDGAKFQGKRYVLEKRVINAHSKNGDSAHLHNYVAKYVEKDSEFSKVVKDRLYKYLFSIYESSVSRSYQGKDFDNWIEVDNFPYLPSLNYSPDIDFITWLQVPENHSLFLKTKHLCEQFHKQSQGFGEYLLDNLDLPYLWKTGCQKFRLPNKNATFIDVPLPIYYYRKLFQEQVYIVDKLVWQYTEVGKKFADIRKFHHVDYLASDIENVFKFYNYHPLVDYRKLANYVVFRENSIGYIPAVSSVDDKLKFQHWFSLKRHGKTYISEFYTPDNVEYVDFCIEFEKFVRINSYHDDYFDDLISKYRDYKLQLSQGRQEFYDWKQHRSKFLKSQYTLF